MAEPMTNNRILLPRTDQRPESNIKGIIISEGNDSSISTSNSLAEGNILSKSSRMGDMAKPGREMMAEIDQMATKAVSGIVPFPVLIFIALRFF
jgi:hypothetical protein